MIEREREIERERAQLTQVAITTTITTACPIAAINSTNTTKLNIIT